MKTDKATGSKDTRSANPVTGLILAGGKSTRMGTNKAFLQIQGQPLIERTIATVRAAGIERMVISGTVPGYECLPDQAPHDGPMGGIRTAFALTDAEAFLVLPIDMPALTPSLLETLMGPWESAYFESFPLPCFLRRCPNVEHGLIQSSVKGLLAASDAVVLTRGGRIETFQNLNTPDDFDAFQIAQTVE